VSVDTTGTCTWLHAEEEVTIFAVMFAIRVFNNKVSTMIIFDVADNKYSMIGGF
jgi:hypothetical protein